MVKQLVYEIVINGQTRVLRTQQDIKQAIKDLQKEMLRFERGGAAFKELERQAVRLKVALKDDKRAIQEQVRALDNQQQAQKRANSAIDESIGYYRRLQAQLTLLKNRYKDLSEVDIRGRIGSNLKSEISGIDRELKRLDGGLGVFTRNVGNYQSAFRGLFGNLGGFAGVLSPIGGGIGTLAVALGALTAKFFEVNKSISAAQSGVQKTTDLTQDQVDSLTESLKELDTATSLEGLLNISEIIGRLGIKGEENVLRLTTAFDKLTIALGDEFTGGVQEVTDQVGRLSNVLFGVTQDGEELQMNILTLGNSLNVLATSGAATAPVITDFAGRIGALGTPLGVLPSEILGISATLQELGVTAERGGTAVGRLFREIAQNPGNFTELLGITPQVLKDAGYEVNSFAELVNKDLVGALRFASTRITEVNDNNVELSQTLKELELNGAGELEVLLKLGQANERLGENIETANSALGNQNSLLKEVEARQNSLSGAVQRLRNTFNELFVNSGIENFFTGVVNGFNDLLKSFSQFGRSAVKTFDDQSIKVQELDSKLPGLLSKYDVLSSKANLNKIEQQKLAETIAQIAELTPSAITQVDEYGNALSINAQASRDFLKAEQERLKYTNEKAITQVEKDIERFKDQQAELKRLSEQGTREITTTNITGSTTSSIALDDQARNKARLDLAATTEKLKGAERELKRLRGEPITEVINKENEVKNKTEETTTTVVKGLNNLKAGTDLVRGSIAFLEDEINKLEAELNRQPTQSGIEKTLEKIADKREDLRQLQAIVDDLQFKIDGGDGLGAGEIERRLDVLRSRLDLPLAKNEIEDNLKQIIALEKDLENIKQTSEDLRKILERRPEDITPIEQLQPRQTQEIKLKDKSKILDDIQEIENQRIKALTAAANNILLTEEQLNSERTRINREADILILQERIKLTVKNGDEYLLIQQEIAEKERAIIEETAARRAALNEQILQTAVDSAQSISDAVFEIQAANVERQLAAELAAIEKREKEVLAREFASEEERAKAAAAFEEEKLQAERKAAAKRKDIAIKQALINGALAATNVFATVPFPASIFAAAAVALKTALEIATIRAQQFAHGGLVRGRTHAQGGEHFQIRGGGRAELESGEAVINRRSIASKDILTLTGTPLQIASAINNYRGYGVAFSSGARRNKSFFEPGGIIGNAAGLPVNTNVQSINMNVELTDDQIGRIAQAVMLGSKQGTQDGSTSGLQSGLRLRERQEALNNKLGV